MRRISGLVAALGLAAATAVAAERPAPTAKPPAVYTPTSLKAERGVPRTRDGHPDLQGAVWEANFFAPLQAPRKGPAPDLILPEAAAKTGHDAFVGGFIKAPFLALDPEAADLLRASKGFPLVRGHRHSRLLVLPADGLLPLTPAALRESEAPSSRERESDNPENRSTMERCLNLGATPPMAMMSAIDPWEFVQTRDHVVIHAESGDEVRIIPFARVHGPAATHPATGDSIARWEGDTLVVETVNFLPRDPTRGSLSGSFVVNPDAKVTERFTRVSRDELVYQFTVEDPKVYAAPWLAEFSLYRAPYRMFPTSCHEGNYGLANILAGAREEERVAAAKPAAPASHPEPADGGGRP
jgi:hypothetical protein